VVVPPPEEKRRIAHRESSELQKLPGAITHTLSCGVDFLIWRRLHSRCVFRGQSCQCRCRWSLSMIWHCIAFPLQLLMFPMLLLWLTQCQPSAQCSEMHHPPIPNSRSSDPPIPEIPLSISAILPSQRDHWLLTALIDYFVAGTLAIYWRDAKTEAKELPRFGWLKMLLCKLLAANSLAKSFVVAVCCRS